MIQNLGIRNFKGIKHLNLSEFGRVNLITGKNNTCKTSLLEGILLYVSKGHSDALLNVFDEREYIYDKGESQGGYEEGNLKILSLLFNGWDVGFFDTKKIIIGEIKTDSFKKEYFTLNLAKFRVDEKDEIIERINTKSDFEKNASFLTRAGLEMGIGEKIYTFRFYHKDILSIFRNGHNRLYDIGFHFLDTRNDGRYNAALWDKVVLTDKEKNVISALRIVESNLEGLSFINGRGLSRTAVLKIKGRDKIIPLSSMGDGINRILSIILSAVNAENGYLLIDEFENGLHHSVQRKLWEVLFHLSKELNIQIFATTHSEDCIRSFEDVLNDDEDNKGLTGKLIRLERKGEEIREVSYDKDELKIATESDIETR